MIIILTILSRSRCIEYFTINLFYLLYSPLYYIRHFNSPGIPLQTFFDNTIAEYLYRIIIQGEMRKAHVKIESIKLNKYILTFL